MPNEGGTRPGPPVPPGWRDRPEQATACYLIGAP